MGGQPASSYWCHTFWHKTVPSVVSIILVSITFSRDQMNPCFFVIVKVCLHLKNILLFRMFENFVLLICEYNQNQKSEFYVIILC